MTSDLDTLLAQGWLAPIDVHLARALGRIGEEKRPEVLLAAALASRQVRMGDTCVHLGADQLGLSLRNDQGQPFPLALPEPRTWMDLLVKSRLVCHSEGPAPLVLDTDGRLYLFRYWQHEQTIATQLKERATAVATAPDPAWLKGRLDALFGERRAEVDWQRVATVMTLMRRLCVISGGPGTGKTYTVTKILALLVEQALRRKDRPPRTVLLAPTGKAAARLAESIKRAKLELPVSDEVREAIPEEAATIHRGLGTVGGNTTRFRFNADNPLPADVVLVDEASMVDVGLMARLVAAVPRRARLVLLGDRDQLASVEAGAVLGDICNAGQATRYSKGLYDQVRELSGEPLDQSGGPRTQTGIWDSIVQLDKSYRYLEHGGIGELARAINAGDEDGAMALLASGAHPEVSLLPLEERGRLPEALVEQALQHYGAYLMETDPERALEAFNRFRVLCALRRGHQGVERINPKIEEHLALGGHIVLDRRFYRGRPIMVTRNDYNQQLFNGDVGITLAGAEKSLALDPHIGDGRSEARAPAGERICFIAPDGSLRSYAPSWLPPHETVYAMTVHKSQGSEFDRVAVVLPEEMSPILTRELLYTAVTRAKDEVVIYGPPEVVRQAIATRLRRQSGLRGRLWGQRSSCA